MALSSEIRKLLQQTLTIRDSQVPFHRVLDILATEDGDVSKAINRFRDIKEESLRRAFHQCALLLRELEREAGLTPGWESASAARTASASPAPGRTSSGGGAGGGSSSAASSSLPAVSKAPAAVAGAGKSPKFRPEDLQPFENATLAGQARMAKLYVDGASKGNPGAAGIGGALFTMGGDKLGQISRSIGTATNNQAEYTALRESLEMARRLQVRQVFVFSDSELMVKQLNGQYKIKNPDIQDRADEVKDLIRGFEKFSITWIPREKNALADALSTNCLAKPAKKGASGKKGPEHEDLMGPVDEDADEGETE